MVNYLFDPQSLQEAKQQTGLKYKYDNLDLELNSLSCTPEQQNTRNEAETSKLNLKQCDYCDVEEVNGVYYPEHTINAIHQLRVKEGSSANIQENKKQEWHSNYMKSK